LACFALTQSVRPFFTGQYLITSIIPNISFELLIRLEYLTTYLPEPLVIIFFIHFFPELFSRKKVIACTLSFAPFFLALPILPLPWLTRSIFGFYAVALVMAIAGFSLLLVPALKKRMVGSRTAFAGAVVIALAAANDAFNASFIIKTGEFLPLSLSVFTFLQIAAIAQRFMEAINKNERLLAEKEMLFKEVHHRVKNSLQIVTSIMAMQRHRTKDPAALEAYDTMTNRIKAVSLVHEKLYSLNAGEWIDVADYAADLVDQLRHSYEQEGARHAINLVSDSVSIPMKMCMDMGLIITELVANSFRHAFKPGHDNAVSVRLWESNGHLQLEVEDSGPGFPRGFNPETADSLGFKILMSLIKKYRGTVFIREGKNALVMLSLRIEGPKAV
jgi:two-component sensor histidine kinase